MRQQHPVALGRALALVSLAACGSGGGFPDASTPLGTYSVAWTIDDLTGRRVPCDQIGATFVEAATTAHGVAPGPTETFLCGNTQGMSEQLVPGLYDVALTLANNGGNIASAPAQPDVQIVAGQNTTLVPVTFTVDATGNFSLLLSSGLASNCGAATATSAGIQTMTLTLSSATNGSCAGTTAAPLTMNVAGGSSYVLTDCTMPPKHACIDANQAITSAMPISAGRYAISVRGQIANANCWAGDVEVTVPALGGTLSSTIMLAYNSAVPGC